MIAFAIIFGLGDGGMVPLRLPLIREHFGTRRFGTILGLIGVFAMTGLIVSPPVAGWVFDTFGVYDPLWLILSGGVVIVATTISTLPPPPGNQSLLSP